MYCPSAFTLAVALSVSFPSIARIAAKNCKIEGIEIVKSNNITSVVTLNTTVSDPTACGDKKLDCFIRKCNSTGLESDHCRVKPGIGECGVYQGRGWLEAFIGNGSSHKVISNKCFSLPGRNVTPKISGMVFHPTHMELNFLEPDVRIESWNVTLYEVQADVHGIYYRCPNREPRRSDEIVQAWQKIGNNTQLRIHYDFNEGECLCFQILANGYNGTALNGVRKFISNTDCKPQRIYAPTPRINEVGPRNWMVETSAFVSILCAILIISVLVIRKLMHEKYTTGVCQLFSYISVDAERGDSLLKVESDILVVYARHDDSHDERVKNFLQILRRKSKCKIYDLYKTLSEDRLEDGNEWLRKRIERDRILIILSPTLNRHLKFVFNAHLTTDNVEVIDIDPTLVYGLRGLVGIYDYSKVFVARFHSENQDVEEEEEEVEKYIEVILKRRRYRIPDHQEALITDVLGS